MLCQGHKCQFRLILAEDLIKPSMLSYPTASSFLMNVQYLCTTYYFTSMGAHPCFSSASFTKAHKVCDFLLAFLDDEALPKGAGCFVLSLIIEIGKTDVAAVFN